MHVLLQFFRKTSRFMRQGSHFSLKLKLAFLLLVSVICFPVFTSTAFAYNRSAAVSYADNWAHGRNPNFYHYSIDCTSFASESMYAGGDSQNTAWHGTSTSLSGDWDNAPDNYNYEINFNGAHLVAKVNINDQAYFSTYDSVQAGDMLYFDWGTGEGISHMAFQVWADEAYNETSGKYDPNFYGDLVDQHTNDRWHAPWSLTYYNTDWDTTTIYEVAHKN